MTMCALPPPRWRHITLALRWRAGVLTRPRCVQPYYGLPTDGKKRWCASCARESHPDAVDLASKKCEDCQVARGGTVISAEKDSNGSKTAA
jgi:hypothetical protein